jgi:hypothetical protein
MVIAVLEDNQERREAMSACLADRFHQFEHRFFADAGEMIAFLKENMQRLILLSLDHDLELVMDSSGKCIDQGDGRHVADFLATQPPCFPVILHSTNTTAVQGMTMALEDAGWKAVRVIPCDDLAWINSSWLRAVRNAIVHSARWAAVKS